MIDELVKAGQAGYAYHQQRKAARLDGSNSNKEPEVYKILLKPTVLHLNGKFFKSGGRVTKARFTLNANGETVEADKDGNPTALRFFGVDDLYFPNLLKKIETDSGATVLREFTEFAKTVGVFNTARVLQPYWNIIHNKMPARTGSVATPYNPPARDENDVTPPAPGSTMKQQLNHYKERASTYKQKNLALKKESSERALDHS